MRAAACGVLMVLGLICAAHAAMAAETTMIPVISSFRHWDHHWYIWLQGDPTYEAVEVMSRDRGAAMPPLAWVFFTERAVPKRQVHYFNDAGVAAARGGHHRDITFAMTGAEGQPRGLKVSLTDTEGRPVAIDMTFDPAVHLTTRGAGLTDQSGHSADRHLLLFFREANAVTSDRAVTRNGIEVAHPRPGESHASAWPAAYSRNIAVAVLPFADHSVAFGASGPIQPDVVRFSQANPDGVAVSDLGDGTKLELVTTPEGRLQRYRHRDGDHVLAIDFAPPLPSTARQTDAAISAVRISIDGFHDLVTGSVNVTRDDKATRLDWHFESPEWARAAALQTDVFDDGNGRARIALRRAQAR